MIKILFLNPSSKIGGAEKSLLDIIKNIERNKYIPILGIPEPGPLGEVAKKYNVNLIIIKLPRVVILSGRKGNIRNLLALLIMPLSIPVVIYRIVSAINSSGAEIVHTNGLKFHLFACLAKCFTKFKLIWHFRDLPDEKLWKFFILFFAKFFPDKIIVNSDIVGKLFLRKKIENKIIRIFNGIDIKNFIHQRPPEDVKKEFGFSGKFVVGMFSMFTEWKGHTILLSAAEKLVRELNDIRFLIAGDALYDTLRNAGLKEKIEKMAKEKGLNGFITFTGYREDVIELINSVDVVVNPSIKPEPFGRVIAEAMALAKPVILTDGGGLSDIVKKNDTGLVIPCNDEEALTQAIYKLYKEPTLREELGRKAREVAKSLFSMEEYISSIQNIYEELIK